MKYQPAIESSRHRVLGARRQRRQPVNLIEREPESTCDFEADPGGPRDCSTPLYSALLRSTPLHSALLRSTPLYSAPLRSTPLHSAPLRSTPLHSAPLQHDTKRAPKTTLNRANRPGGGSRSPKGHRGRKRKPEGYQKAPKGAHLGAPGAPF